MSRIRSIKPDFFSSADVCGLSPLARLLFIGTWCEADREGRLKWNPATLKIRYLPAESCDINALCQEIVDAGLVVIYGDNLAHIPSFKSHQVINGREADSELPGPEMVENEQKPARDIDASRTRQDASRRKEGRKEGKGREDASHDASASASRGSRLPPDWQPTPEERRWAGDERPDLVVKTEIEKFRDYWHAKTGQAATKRDWSATWRNWIRNAHGSGKTDTATARPRLKEL